jgi:hypothetical protein
VTGASRAAWKNQRVRRRDREFIREQSGDLRAFVREQTLIANRRMDRFAEESRRNWEEIRRMREAMDRHFDDQEKKTDELLAESRAQRNALLVMIDRLDNGGAAAAG